MAYRIAPISIKMNDVQDHAPKENLLFITNW